MSSRLLGKINKRNIKKGFKLLSQGGPKALARRMKKINSVDAFANYNEWYLTHMPGDKELEEQKNTRFSYSPLISVIVPTYNTPEKFLIEMIESVRSQSYENWELCVADGSENNDTVERILKQYGERDSRIRFMAIGGNYGIAGNTNYALDMAKGDYISLLDHDDTLSPDALFEIVKAINKQTSVDVIYSDEDKVNMDLSEYFDPHFKPDFNLYLLRSNNYICHLFTVKADIIRQGVRFNSEFDGSQDYDFILNSVERAKHIEHIPKILYHWRTHKASTASNPESKMYCYDAGKRAIEAHLKRCGIVGSVSMLDNYGFYRVNYSCDNSKSAAIIINDDCKSDKCINNILKNTDYANYKIYVKSPVDSKDSDRVIVTGNDLDRNGISEDYIVYMSSQCEVLKSDWLNKLIAICGNEDVAVTGPKLLNRDNTVYSAGMIVTDTRAVNAFSGIDSFDPGYYVKAMTIEEVSCVAKECLLVKNELAKKYAAYSDSSEEICRRLIKAGYKVVFEPGVIMYYSGERTDLCTDAAVINDPYYNVNLSFENGKSYVLGE